MTQEAARYAIWTPEHDGHAPPNWREGMRWTDSARLAFFDGRYSPKWRKGWNYYVEPEALNSPNDDASGDYGPAEQFVGKLIPAPIEDALYVLRQYPAETLAKHGITLDPEKDWATELWADLHEVRGLEISASDIRKGTLYDQDKAAIALIRERVVLKEGV